MSFVCRQATTGKIKISENHKKDVEKAYLYFIIKKIIESHALWYSV